MPTVEDAFARAGAALKVVEVYDTLHASRRMDGPWDGILFFSTIFDLSELRPTKFKMTVNFGPHKSFRFQPGVLDLATYNSIQI